MSCAIVPSVRFATCSQSKGSALSRMRRPAQRRSSQACTHARPGPLGTRGILMGRAQRDTKWGTKLGYSFTVLTTPARAAAGGGEPRELAGLAPAAAAHAMHRSHSPLSPSTHSPAPARLWPWRMRDARHAAQSERHGAGPHTEPRMQSAPAGPAPQPQQGRQPSLRWPNAGLSRAIH